MPHLPVPLLPYFFWTACAMTALVAVDLLFFCASRRRFLAGFLVATVSALSLVAFHLSDNYTGVGINEATWYHMLYGREGLTWGLLMPIVQTVVLGVVGVALLGWGSYKLMRKRRTNAGGTESRRRNLAWVAPYILAVALSPGLVQATGLVVNALNRDAYRAELVKHMAPIQTLTAITKPKSVVYIYGESLEGTFLDERIFPGLAPNLIKLREHALSLEGQRQAPFTGWTIAGIIASQCAFPAIGQQDHQHQSSSGDMMCLGDLLHEQGYTLNYFNGADLSFTGKALFFQSHHYDLTEGKQELQKRLPEVKTSSWGVRDEDLFKVVSKRFDELAAQDKPFFLGTLTVDTHPPKGYPSDVCKDYLYGDGKNGMLNAVHCSDHLIGELVRKIQASKRDDIIVVVASDHLQSAAASEANSYLVNAPDRHNLWMAMGASITPQRVYREGTTFDITPTLLSLMGYDVPAMHLGRDLRRPGKSLTEQYGQDAFFDRVASAFSRNEDGRWEQNMANPSRKVAQK